MRFAGILFLAACSSSAPKPAAPEDKPAPTGKVGDVCHRGVQHSGGDEVQVVACNAGLNCCYLCGIPGCDSTCYAGDCPTDIP